MSLCSGAKGVKRALMENEKKKNKTQKTLWLVDTVFLLLQWPLHSTSRGLKEGKEENTAVQ